MDSASGSSLTKAFFTNLDTRSAFTVQFNPRELRLDDGAVWAPAAAMGQSHPHLNYARGQSATLSMELVFDSTDTGANVHERFVQPLRGFLETSVEGRPPTCAFTWGPFQFEGVVEWVSAHYLMFSAQGTPLRARVAVALKHVPHTVHRPSSQASSVTVRSGDTLSSLAAACGVGARLLALANGIDDPMRLEAGARLVIPRDEAHAHALDAERRRRRPGNWRAPTSGSEGPW